VKNANLTHDAWNTIMGKPENQCNIHHVLNDPILYSTKPSSNSQLPHWSGRFGTLNESQHNMTKNGMGWRIVTIARIRFKRQVTATPGFSSLYDWSVLKMWLFSDEPDHAAGDIVRQMNGANPLRSK
jgi:hypothetical protein